MKTTCTKRYDNFPFAHRQHLHDGHCALIHGHNWSFEFEFSAGCLDENNFVIDFGKLKWLKDWLTHHFDHTLVLNADDPMREHLLYVLTDVRPDPASPDSFDLARVRVLPNGSAEGLAAYVFGAVSRILEIEQLDARDRGIALDRVTVFEDTKNSATFRS